MAKKATTKVFFTTKRPQHNPINYATFYFKKYRHDENFINALHSTLSTHAYFSADQSKSYFKNLMFATTNSRYGIRILS